MVSAKENVMLDVTLDQVLEDHRLGQARCQEEVARSITLLEAHIRAALAAQERQELAEQLRGLAREELEALLGLAREELEAAEGMRMSEAALAEILRKAEQEGRHPQAETLLQRAESPAMREIRAAELLRLVARVREAAGASRARAESPAMREIRAAELLRLVARVREAAGASLAREAASG